MSKPEPVSPAWCPSGTRAGGRAVLAQGGDPLEPPHCPGARAPSPSRLRYRYTVQHLLRVGPAPGRAGRHGWMPVLFVTGMLALAFNLRAAITSLPPVFPELALALHLSPAVISALAAVPVLCFAVF